MIEQQFWKGACEHCGGHIEFPSSAEGNKIDCPHCAVETVLVSERAANSAGELINAAELKACYAGSVPPQKTSFLYQAGLLLVAVFMLLLPMAYLAFVGFAGYCVYWYAVDAWPLFSGLTGGIHLMILKLLLYVGPIMGGSVAVFFMFKPLLAPRACRIEPVELNPSEHPRVYQLIAHTSDLLAAPMPKRIYLDASLNAAAGFRRGGLSIFGGEPVLTLGLPLAAGLDLQQFGAVVAHELGHGTQALAMRFGYIINVIDRWFMRVVYERDTWDEALQEWADSVEDWRVSMIVACVSLGVWASRKVLTGLMLCGHTTSCFLSRQMEYHADDCAMAVSGSAGLESLLIRLRELTVLESLAYEGLSQFWKKRHQLPGSLPDFFDELERRLPEDFHEQARQTLLNETAGPLATHPTAAQRIRKARQKARSGILTLNTPARALFRDFGATAQLVTGRHYRQTLRLAVTPAMLRPAGDFFQDQQRRPTPVIAIRGKSTGNAGTDRGQY